VKKPVVSILLATQRSGTNFLRSVLNSHPDLDCYPEVFLNPRPDEDLTAGYRHGIQPFWHFFRDRLEADPMTGMPDNRPEPVRQYFETLSETADTMGRTILVDVKYNSLHHMDQYWRTPTAPPEMLKFFAAQEYPIIHLTRNDPVRVAVSLLHARETSQYVASKEQAVRSSVITPDPVEFHHLLRGQRRNRDLIRNWLRKFPEVLEIAYEDLLDAEDASGMNAEAFGRIETFLGLEARTEFRAKTKRTTARPLQEVLGNFGAIQKRLAGTEFECYLDDPTGPKSPVNAPS
jgi:LPS sulfotransferase NodH